MLSELVVYILQILKSRTSYTTAKRRRTTRARCVYPSNLEIKNILYNCRPWFHFAFPVVYILQILKSRTSYTTLSHYIVLLLWLCISYNSWNQEHPIQRQPRKKFELHRCVYPSNLEIKNILYNTSFTWSKSRQLCISFKSWNQEHPIQQATEVLSNMGGCVYPSNLEIKNILYNKHYRYGYPYRVVYILQILKSRTSYTTILILNAINNCCVYPSNLEIKNILYN